MGESRGESQRLHLEADLHEEQNPRACGLEQGCSGSCSATYLGVLLA